MCSPLVCYPPVSHQSSATRWWVISPVLPANESSVQCYLLWDISPVLPANESSVQCYLRWVITPVLPANESSVQCYPQVSHLQLVQVSVIRTASPRSRDTCRLSSMSHLLPRIIFSTSSLACYTTYTTTVQCCPPNESPLLVCQCPTCHTCCLEPSSQRPHWHATHTHHYSTVLPSGESPLLVGQCPTSHLLPRTIFSTSSLACWDIHTLTRLSITVNSMQQVILYNISSNSQLHLHNRKQTPVDDGNPNKDSQGVTQHLAEQTVNFK